MKIYSLLHIETPRLLLRPMSLGDEDSLYQSISRSLVSLRPWMVWAKTVSLDSVGSFVKYVHDMWQAQCADQFPLVIIHKADGVIIGGTGYNERSIPIKGVYEVGYWLDVQYQGRGLASECLNALVRYAFEALQAQRVQLSIEFNNEKSLAVAERTGFTYELTKMFDRRDCVTQKLSHSLIWARYDSKDLPPLTVTWLHAKSNCVEKNSSAISILHPPVPILPVLVTGRLRIAPPTRQAAIDYQSSLIHSLHEVQPWFSWAKEDMSLEEIERHLEEGMQAAANPQAHNHIFFLVWDQSSGAFVGEAWFKIIDWSVPYFNLAYWFDSRYQGQGYATEALEALIRFAFSEWQVNRLELDISLQNFKSLRLAKRLNFIQEGVLRRYARNFVTNQVMDVKLFSLNYLDFTLND